MTPIQEENEAMQAAEIMVRQYGEEAEPEAAYWADKAAKQGDMDGERAWKLITNAVKVLLKETHSTMS